ncbi:hypothetical protein [Pseudoalteromonas sp. MEBiC 03485]|uniref:hypothetical protein n=2 Tax=Pseudoalteromonas TaxID=53246 RepID=UPI00101F5812|nr:hypothetical protein [Pseudoalteromonas sp. MEBiC 03485]RZD19696.1 hypothetical protein EVU92_21070 [Pseudoalteromonas sp. MEBiC 03485]
MKKIGNIGAWAFVNSVLGQKQLIEDKEKFNMAKKSVKEFSVTLFEKYVEVSITTENVKPHKYRIYPDERQGSDIKRIASHIQNGLETAKSTSKKIGISDFKERRYVFLELPNDTYSTQYTADKL